MDPNLFFRPRQSAEPEPEPAPVKKESKPPSTPQAGGSVPVDPGSPHGHILSRINEEKRQERGRESHDRMMLHDVFEKEIEWQRQAHDRELLHDTFAKELNKSLAETKVPLHFETYAPGDSSLELPGYFAAVINQSTRPEYLAPYSVDDFARFRLFKAVGLDAGFALKPDGDIVTVHNNSSQRNLAKPLLEKAIAEGGTKLDHFDGGLSKVYAEHFPEIERDEPWDDEYAPNGWKYEPVKMEDSIHAQEHKRQGETPDAKMSQLRENYAKGKPSIVYRSVTGYDEPVT